ncbi:MAG: dTMP kinase [Thermodesulfobacteriota bacterium]|nr:dTMP kinase [Thermodesulfobacteriota bacterium]
MFITFEGIEGSGKSSVLADMRSRLEERGFDVVATLEPGGSRLGVELRRILLDMSSRDLTGESELFLYMADRAQHVSQVIRPALEAGKIVLSDRFADSTVAYQGYGRGLDPALLHSFNHMAAAALKPDMTLLFDLPAELGLKRAQARNTVERKSMTEGRFEAESVTFHERVRQGYLTWAALNKERFRVIDAAKPLGQVCDTAWDVIDRELAAQGKTPAAPKTMPFQ